MINRDEYLNQLIAFKDKQLIKVVSGIRRCGKSTLFELYKDYLLECGVDDSQLITLNLESAEFYHFGKSTTPDQLDQSWVNCLNLFGVEYNA